ncbi:MAG: hypothetical protein QM677_04855 [Microbacterium sp.]
MKPSDALPTLRTRAQLDARGAGGRALDRSLAAKTTVRVATGWYASGDVWRAEYAEGRHLLRVAATFTRVSADAVAILVSAAVLHGLPLWRIEPRRVHLAGPRLNGQTAVDGADVARHRIAIPNPDIVTIAGIRCTSLARTTADLLCRFDAVRGLAVADAALRVVAWNAQARTYDEHAAEALRAQIASRLRPGSRGVKLARSVLELADGRSENAGESASRMLLIQLGFAPPRVQVALPAQRSGFFYVDFGIDDAGAWGEYDGDVKYTDASLRRPGQDAADVVLAEKEREDWIRATTHRGFARWGSKHLALDTLGARLAAFQVFPPR